MMSSSEEEGIQDAGKELQEELSLKTEKLNKIDANAVRLQCVNSYDFLVGKKTNFNGPVTIINYADGNESETTRQPGAEPDEIVIKERLEETEIHKIKNSVAKKDGDEKGKAFVMWLSEGEYRSNVKHLCMRNIFKVPVFVWILILFLIVAGCVTLAVELTREDYPEDTKTFSGEKRNYTLYSRKQWGAVKEKSSVEMKLPVPYVIISNTNRNACEDLSKCRKLLRDQQRLQMRSSLADIYPNFLISSDGSAYEGRGWNKRNAYLGLVNSKSLEISFMGDFAGEEKPTEEQAEAAKALIFLAVKENRVKEDYILFPANGRGITLPQEKPVIARNLYQVIKEWPRFMPDPYQLLFSAPPML